MEGAILRPCAVIFIAEAYSSRGKPNGSFALENYCPEEAQNRFAYSQETNNFSSNKVDLGYFENRPSD